MNAPAVSSSHSPALGKHHLAGLDGLRGVACLLVFIYHLRSSAGDPSISLGGIDLLHVMKNCDAGVAIFFALSGLLLSLPFWKSIFEGAQWPDYKRYLWRRACRIIPAYYACLIVVYLFRGGTYTFYGFLDFLLHVTFLHPFSEESYCSVHGVLWTIGIEFQFYLLLPLVMAGVAAGWRRLGPWGTALILFAGTWLVDLATIRTLSALVGHIPERFLIANGHVVQGTIFSFLRFFAIGILAGALTIHLRRHESTRLAYALGLIGLVGSIAFLGLSAEGTWRTTAVNAWPFNMICYGLLAAALPAAPLLSRFFAVKPLVFAGHVSYGIYLWHNLVLKSVFAGTLPGRLQGGALLIIGGAVALAVTALVAWLSFRFIEKPAMEASYPFVEPSAP